MQPESDEVARARDEQRERLEQRSEARRRKVLRAFPETGQYLLAMSDEPTAASAFDDGTPWQRWVAELVREAFPTGVFLFRRRRGAGRDDDIDIVGVLPTGVWVIDMRRYEDAKAEVRPRGAGARADSYLAIDGVDASAALDDLADQSDAVASALQGAGWEHIATHSVLCLIDVDPTWRGHAIVGRACVVKARPMLRLLAAGPAVLDDSDVASVGLSLDKALPRQLPHV